MSAFKDPFNPDVQLPSAGCGCGRHASRAEHDADLAAHTSDSELLGSRAVESAVMRALFPHDATRRNFIRAVGAGTAMAAVSTLFPLAAAKEAFAQSGGAKLEEFLPRVQVGKLIPGADRFGPVVSTPAAVAPAYSGDKLLGYAYLTSQYVNTNGYSSKPIHIVVGLDTEGTIVGLELVEHSEPIVLIGIPEERVVAYIAHFLGYNPVKASAEGRGMPKADREMATRIHEIVKERRSVTADTAERLARYFGGDAASWLALQAAYDLKTLPTREEIRKRVEPRKAA